MSALFQPFLPITPYSSAKFQECQSFMHCCRHCAGQVGAQTDLANLAGWTLVGSLFLKPNVDTNLRNPVASLFSGRGCLVCAFLDRRCLISFICWSYAKSQSLSHIPIHPLSSSLNPNPHQTMPYLDLRELNALTQLANRGGLGSAIAYVPLTHVHKSS